MKAASAEHPVTKLKYALRAPLAYGVLVPDKYDGPDAVRLVRITDVADGRVEESGLERISPMLDSEYSRTRLKAGDLVVSVVGTLGESFIVPTCLEGANLSRALARVQLDPRQADVRFVRYWIQSASFSDQVDQIAHGSAQKVLNLSSLGDFSAPLPSLARQRGIVDVLDRKTAAVDALITKKDRMLALLTEKRQALITQAVTQGLDPGVPTMESGDDVLPSIPQDWHVVTLRYLLSFGPKNGVSPPPATGDGVLSFSISAVRDGKVTVEGNEKYVELDRAAARVYWLERGDILVMRGNGNLSLVGTCGIVDTVPEECTYPDILMKIRAGSQVIPEFLVAAVNSPYVRGQVEMLAKTSNGTFKISGEDVRTLKIAVPPFAEQRRIVAHIDGELRRLEGVFTQVAEQLDRLREYRQALITAGVTGQLDIAQEAA